MTVTRRHNTMGCDVEIDSMVARLIRDVCPSCSHVLRIRLKNMGKMVECKFCGHRFRAPIDPDLLDPPAENEAGGPPAGLQDAGGRREPRVPRFLEQELQKT